MPNAVFTEFQLVEFCGTDDAKDEVKLLPVELIDECDSSDEDKEEGVIVVVVLPFDLDSGEVLIKNGTIV